ncbi:hypothetical protein [Pseudomonas phoenicis]|uniref:hypothetical protein n=1 Tax=unclassified Pseudomonas TaxID=196821 RepID=UPI0039A36DAB
MANAKKQDKTSTVPEQAAAASKDQSVNAPSGGNDASNADAAAGGAATISPLANSGVSAMPQAGDPVTELPVEMSPLTNLAKYGAGGSALPGQSGQIGDVLHASQKPADLDELTLSTSVEVNPAKVTVYPLRSFMDEGELRRRRGPGYLVPRLHAEDLERRNLVSRTPLEE